ncbi:MAG TPA: cyclic nucleotide-gated ion channel [Stellaceae bacterium]|nr:cyclic nucleotide-gated ion channel [Stellaceae bacterium]
MNRRRLYLLLRPEGADPAARIFRAVHHLMAAAGIAVMLMVTVAPLEAAYSSALALGFYIPAAFFLSEYLLRLIAAPEAPGGEHRGDRRARFAWVISLAGLFDLVSGLPGILALIYGPAASLLGFVWAFKYVRYSPGLASLGRVIRNAQQALLSVLLGFSIVLLTAASTAYLLERHAHPDHPEAFASIPAALWWGIVTMTTTGYGDIVPRTVAGRALSGIVMVGGILIFALWTGILVNGYAEELRRREFLRTWELVAKVPFFHHIGASLIAEVARLLRPRDYPTGAVVVRRGEPGDCMYFVADGEVEVQLQTGPLRLGSGEFFGELALLTGDPRNASVVAAESCTLLALDIVDFHELLARQPELARVIREEARKRLGGDLVRHRAQPAVAADGSG